MLRPLFLAAVSALLSTAALAEPATYKIDSTHSEADFTIRHMAISNVHGRFGNIKGNITFDPDDVTKSTVEATIDTTTGGPAPMGARGAKMADTVGVARPRKGKKPPPKTIEDGSTTGR